MKTLKTILFYFIYTIISISLCMLYKYLELGMRPNSPFVSWIHDYIIILFGIILGLISVGLFFIINHFGIKNKVNEFWKLVIIQLIVLVVISFLVNKIHYILEFNLDVI